MLRALDHHARAGDADDPRGEQAETRCQGRRAGGAQHRQDVFESPTAHERSRPRGDAPGRGTPRGRAPTAAGVLPQAGGLAACTQDRLMYVLRDGGPPGSRAAALSLRRLAEANAGSSIRSEAPRLSHLGSDGWGFDAGTAPRGPVSPTAVGASGVPTPPRTPSRAACRSTACRLRAPRPGRAPCVCSGDRATSSAGRSSPGSASSRSRARWDARR